MSEPVERCTWCGEAIAEGEGFRLLGPGSHTRAAFCRLEHIVPWQIKGARWEVGSDGAAPTAGRPEACSACSAQLAAEAILLVRHRGPHRIEDGFCDVAHLAAWAKAGGRWQ